MHSGDPIEALIREVDDQYRPTNSDEKIYYFDVEAKECCAAPKWWERWTKTYRTFTVSPTETANHNVSDIKIQGADGSVSMILKYHVRLRDANNDVVKQAIRTLAAGDDALPGTALNKAIEQWITASFIEEQTEGEEDFLDRYFTEYASRLKGYIPGKAKAMGLDLVVKSLELQKPSWFDPFEISSVIQVGAKDYTHQLLKMQLKFEVQVDAQDRMTAYMKVFPKDEVQKEIEQNIKRELYGLYTLDHFYRISPDMYQKVREIIAKALSPWGRVSAYEKIEFIDVFLTGLQQRHKALKEQSELATSVEVPIYGSIEVPIKFRIKVADITNLAKFATEVQRYPTHEAHFEALKETLVDTIKSLMQDSNNLKDYDSKNTRALFKRIAKKAIKRVAKDDGIGVTIGQVIKEKNFIDIAISDDRQDELSVLADDRKAERQSIKKDLKKLREQRHEMLGIGVDPDDSDLVKIDKLIESLQRKLRDLNNPTKDIGDIVITVEENSRKRLNRGQKESSSDEDSVDAEWEIDDNNTTNWEQQNPQ